MLLCLYKFHRIESSAALLVLGGCALVSGAQAPASPARTEALYRAGYEAYNRGDLRTADAQFARLVMLAPKIAVGHAAYGEVLLAEGNAAAALAQLELAHQMSPHAPETSVAIAHASLALSQPSKAALAFADAVKAGASLTSEETRDYAGVLAAIGQPREAISILNAALQPATRTGLAPAQLSMLEDALGTLLAQQSSFDQASSHFAAAIAANPESAGAHAHLGAAALAQQQPETAVEELQRATALAPADAEYATLLGRALTADGQDTEAVRVLRQAVAMADKTSALPQPGKPGKTAMHAEAARTTTAGAPGSGVALPQQARYALAMALQAAGELPQAIALFADYTAAQPGDAAALTNYALALVQTGNARDALPLYGRALAHGPDNPTLREDYGVAYLQQSDLNHAIEQFQAGIALQPDNPHLHYDLGLAYKLKDNLPAAIPEFERAEALDPALPDPPYTLGVIRMQQGDFSAAATQLEQAVALRPANGAAWAVLGNVYKENGDPRKAADALRQAIALQPEQPSPHISLAAILAQQGDREGASTQRKLAADLSRAAVSRQRASFALKSGRALLSDGKLKEAEAQLRTATQADPEEPDAHLALAEALTREGRLADAALERKQGDSLKAARTQP